MVAGNRPGASLTRMNVRPPRRLFQGLEECVGGGRIHRLRRRDDRDTGALGGQREALDEIADGRD